MYTVYLLTRLLINSRLPLDGYRQKVTVRWLPQDGYRQKVTVRWLPLDGYYLAGKLVNGYIDLKYSSSLN